MLRAKVSDAIAVYCPFLWCLEGVHLKQSVIIFIYINIYILLKVLHGIKGLDGW